MKKVLIGLLIFTASFTVAVSSYYYFLRDSRPVVLCTSLDDSIRPRNSCLMNPFRYKQPEILAEAVLEQLKNGNPNSILPYLSESSEDMKKHFVENETKYRVANWRIGDRTDSIAGTYVMYWVSRNDYFNGYEENVFFSVVKEGENWKLKQFNAGY